MHDVTFANEIINALTKRLKTLEKGHEIILVKAALSPLSHVKPETLKETFMALVKDTPFEHVSIRVKVLQLGIRCESCKKEYMIDKPVIKCPGCLSSDINVIYSKEFAVESIEVSKKT